MSGLGDKLKLLHRHRELLETIYLAREFVATPETSRALSALHAARILICSSSGMYRLHPRERRYFSECYEQIRPFESGAPLREEIERLEEILSAAVRADTEGDDEGFHLLADEAIETLVTLHVEVDDQIRKFDLQLRNGYHDARTAEEKLLRNAYYEKRVMDLSQIVVTLNQSAVRDWFLDGCLREVEGWYAQEIDAFIDPWSARLAALSDEISNFRYRTKNVIARTKKFRKLCHALDGLSYEEKIEALQHTEKSFVPLKLRMRVGVDFGSDLNAEATLKAAARITAGAAIREQRVSRLSSKVAPRTSFEEEPGRWDSSLGR